MNKIYAYRDYATSPSRVFKTLAEDILEADENAREKGFNPLRLVCCIGVIVEFIDPALIKARPLWTDPKTGVVEYIQTSGVVLRSTVMDDVETYSAFVNDNEDRLPPGLDIYLEYPGFVKPASQPDRRFLRTSFPLTTRLTPESTSC